MKRETILTWGAIVVLGGLSAWLGWWLGQRALMPDEKPAPPGMVITEVGQPVPELSLPDLRSGERVTVSGPGRLRLINYWASWCAVCRFTTPTVEQLWQDGENVLTVALRSGNTQQLSKGMGKKGLTFPTHNDERGDLAARWQVSVTPSFLIVKDGKVVSTTTGWSSGLGLKLRLAWARLQ